MFVEYDCNYPSVFLKLKELIIKQLPIVLVEHVGSTSIVNCGGKGIIDIAVLYRQGQLELAKNGLETLGFQKQISIDPFPESRPMRVGSIKWKNKKYKIHAHVIKFGCKEHFELVYLRDRLNIDLKLKNEYEKEKQRILTSGITNSLKYSVEKGIFIKSSILMV